jgi:lipopolysaccharide/colanic/teichoic acid biosynthesis glycosyltransferase
MVMAMVGLILSSPLLIGIMVWIKKDSEGPIFYRGIRVGRNGKEFAIFKFRSMIEDADKSGVSSTSSEDSRITSSGHFIRRWKLDELAQLINVAKGDMSLVGPRPEVKAFTDLYSGEELEILSLRPGITDWASIWNSDEGGILEGALDADAVYLKVIRPVKLELQLYYYHNRSFFNDIKILFYTVYRIFKSSFVPGDLSTYSDFKTLRGQAMEVIEEQRVLGKGKK